MNDDEMTDLLQRASRDLAPDVPALVAEGLRRGRVRQRRRRTAGALAVGATAVLVIAVGAQLTGPDRGGGRGVAPADPTSPSGSARTAGAEPTVRAELAVTTAQVPTTFASLEPGQVSAPSPKSGPDTAPVVDFTWEGFAVRVGLTPDDYVSGHSVPDPAQRCAEQAAGNPCRPGPDGTVVSTSSFTNPEVDGGTSERSVNVFRPDGWDVLVVAYNGPSRDGPVTADEPPFDIRELKRIASSDVWFR